VNFERVAAVQIHAAAKCGGFGAEMGTTTSGVGKVEQSIQSTEEEVQGQSCNSVAFIAVVQQYL
jgi:hypothetical protein